MTLVDAAVYRDGRRVLGRDRGRGAHRGAGVRRHGVGRALPPRCRGDARDRRGARPAPARRGGHARRPSAGEAGALRRHDVPRAAARAVPGRVRDCRVRRGARLRRPRLCDHGPARREPRPRDGPPSPRGEPRDPPSGSYAVVWAICDVVVDQYLPVVAGVENDIDEIEDELFIRDPTVSQAHLRAAARGDRSAARDGAAAVDVRPAPEDRHGGHGGIGDAGVPRRRRSRPPRRRAGGHLPRDPRQRAHRARDDGRAGEQRGDAADGGARPGAERPGEEGLGLGGHPVRPDARGHDLRHELRAHAGAGVGVRLPDGARPHGRDERRPCTRCSSAEAGCSGCRRSRLP